MSFFKPVDFSKEKEQLKANPEPEKEEIIFPDKLKDALSKISEEIDKVYSGQSKFVKYPIYDKPPVMLSFERLEKYQTVGNIKGFIEMSRQDFGESFAKMAQELLDEAWEEKIVER